MNIQETTDRIMSAIATDAGNNRAVIEKILIEAERSVPMDFWNLAPESEDKSVSLLQKHDAEVRKPLVEALKLCRQETRAAAHRIEIIQSIGRIIDAALAGGYREDS